MQAIGGWTVKIISRMLATAAALSGLLSSGHDAWSRTKPEITSLELASMEMFMMGQYKDLDRELNRIQAEYEKEKWDSRDLIALMQQPFVAKEPEFEVKYNAWLTEYPNSYAAHQARAYYYTNLAIQKLNGRKPDQLSSQELSEVKRYADLAIADDSAALNMASKPYVAYDNLVYLYALTGAWDKSRQMLDAANGIAPTNTTARYQYAHALSEFGRPFEEIKAFVGEVRKSEMAKKYLSDYDNILHGRLLHEGQFDQLDAEMNQVQHDYEAGKIDDRILDAYFVIFTDTNPTLEAVYNAWVEAHPNSYAARQARALFYSEVAMNARGGKYSKDTSAEEMSGLAHYMKLAFEDDQVAMSLTDKPIIAVKNVMIIERYFGSDDGCAQMLALADKIDPKNMIVRHDYMRSLQTRWGGSLKDMEKFMTKVKVSGLLPEDDIKDLEDMIITEKLWLADRKADEYSTIGELQTGF